jgi:hypothetical protein
MVSGRVTTIRCTGESGHVRMITRLGQSVVNLVGCRDGEGATAGNGRLADTPDGEARAA